MPTRRGDGDILADQPEAGLLELHRPAYSSARPGCRAFHRRCHCRGQSELAFILGKRLEGDSVTIFDVLSATDYVIPAMEIIDARIHRLDPDTKRPRKVFDTISDNAANAGIVIRRATRRQAAG